MLRAVRARVNCLRWVHYSVRAYLGFHAVCFQREISVCVVSRLAGHGQAWRGAGWGVGSKIDDL